MKYVTAFIAGLAVFLLSATGAAAAEDAVCSAENPLPPGTYRNVEADPGCDLDAGHIIEGSLVINGGFEQPVVDGTRVAGDLAAFGEVSIVDAHVGGSIFLFGGYSSSVSGTQVGGDIWIDGAFGFTTFIDNEVGGSMILDGPGSDGVIATGNVIGEHLLVNNPAGNFNIDGNQVGGHLRLTGAVAYNAVRSTVSGNTVGEHIEITRNRISIIPEAQMGVPSIVVTDNVIQRHAGIIDNVGVEVTGNDVGGTLICRSNTDFAHSDNQAANRLMQCSE